VQQGSIEKRLDSLLTTGNKKDDETSQMVNQTRIVA
jgi:hypothetical protein